MMYPHRQYSQFSTFRRTFIIVSNHPSLKHPVVYTKNEVKLSLIKERRYSSISIHFKHQRILKKLPRIIQFYPISTL